MVSVEAMINLQIQGTHTLILMGEVSCASDILSLLFWTKLFENLKNPASRDAADS